MRQSDRVDMGPEANDHTWCLPRDSRTCCQAQLLRWSSSCKPRMGVAKLIFQVVEKVTDQLSYWPRDIKLYSSSGCKRVAQKIDLIVEEMEEEREGMQKEEL